MILPVKGVKKSVGDWDLMFPMSVINTAME